MTENSNSCNTITKKKKKKPQPILVVMETLALTLAPHVHITLDRITFACNADVNQTGEELGKVFLGIYVKISSLCMSSDLEQGNEM